MLHKLNYLLLLCLLLSAYTNAQEVTPPAAKKMLNPIKLTPQPVPEELLYAGIGAIGGQVFPLPSQFQGKLPLPEEQLHERLTGVFINDPQIIFVIFKSSKDELLYDRLIIDTNANQRLDDEKVLTIPQVDNKAQDLPVKIFLGGRQQTLNFRTDYTNAWLIYPSIQGGTLPLNGKMVKTAVFCPDNSYSMSYSILFVDKNNDGRFEISRNPLQREYFFTTPVVSINDSFYNFDMTADAISLNRINPTSEINLMLPATAPAGNKYYFELIPEGGGSRDMLFVFTDKLPLKIPNGTYALIDAGILSADNQELLTYSYPDFTVKDSTQLIDVHKLKTQIAIGQTPDGNVLKVAQKTSGTSKSIIKHVGDLDPEVGPEVIITRKNEPDKILLKFNLEFG